MASWKLPFSRHLPIDRDDLLYRRARSRSPPPRRYVSMPYSDSYGGWMMPEEWPSEHDSVYRRPPPMMYSQEPTYHDSWRRMPPHDWADDSYFSFRENRYSPPPTRNHGDNRDIDVPPITPTMPTPVQTPSTATPTTTDYHCNVCNIYVTDQNQLDNHYRGFKHILMCNRQKQPISAANSVIVSKCTVCGKHMTRLEVNSDMHKGTDRHLKWVETYKRHHRGKEPNNDGMFTDVVMSKSEMEEVMKLELNQEGYKCDICNVTLLTYEIYQKHVLGQKHQKQLFRQSNGENTVHHCKVCDIHMIGGERAFQAHLDGQKHRKKMGIKAPPSTSTPSVAAASKTKATKCEFYCEICDINCNSLNTFNNHINGKQHKRKINKQ